MLRYSAIAVCLILLAASVAATQAYSQAKAPVDEWIPVDTGETTEVRRAKCYLALMKNAMTDKAVALVVKSCDTIIK